MWLPPIYKPDPQYSGKRNTPDGCWHSWCPVGAALCLQDRGIWSSSDLTTGLPSFLSNTCNAVMTVSRCRVERPPTLLLWRGSTSISARPLSSPVLLTLARGCAPRRQGRQIGAGGWQEPRSRDPGGLAVLPANTAQRTGQDRTENQMRQVSSGSTGCRTVTLPSVRVTS